MQTNKEKVRSWRVRRAMANLSLEELATRAGKKAPQLSNYENGKTEPKAYTIDKIEEVLKKYGV